MMRLYNQKLILRILKDRGSLSKSELSRITQLTIPSVTDILAELESYHLINDGHPTPAKRGRFPTLHKLNGGAYKVIGVTIESESIKTALINLNGDILDSLFLSLPAKPTPESVVNEVARAVKTIMEKAHITKQELIGLGLGMHGIVNPAIGTAVYPPHLSWRNVPIGELLEHKLEMPVKVDNDCNTLALAERWYGEGKGTESFIVINIDYGVGAGILLDDRLFYGSNYGGGQIGHTVVKDDGPLCSCGNYGCLESIASEPALLREAIEKVKKGFPSKILELAGTVQNISIEHLYRSAELQDVLAINLLKTAGRYSGVAASTLVNLFNPQKIIITGGILRGNEHVLTPLTETVRHYSLETNAENLEVMSSKIGSHSTVLGAATLWINELFKGNLPVEKLISANMLV